MERGDLQGVAMFVGLVLEAGRGRFPLDLYTEV